MSNVKNGTIRVGIDMDNKGFVEFERNEADPLNLKPEWATRFTDTVLLGGVDTNEDVQYLFYPQPSYVFTSTDGLISRYIGAINPFGSELTRVTLDATEGFGGVEFTKTVDTPSGKFSVSPSTEYTLWAWVASDEPIVNNDPDFFTVSVRQYDSGDTLVAETVAHPDLAVAYRVYSVQITFTTDASTDYLGIAFFRDFLSSPPLANMFVLGMGLYSGEISTEPLWNAGSSNGHLDDITDYVESAEGFIGKSTWEQLMFDEGTLSLRLNNEDRRFSPEYASSPYYNLLNPSLRVIVLFTDSDDNYKLLWSGWTHQIFVEPGITNSRKATLTARQGRFSFEAQDPTTIQPRENIDSSEAIRELFKGGYQFATGSNTIFASGEPITENYERGVEIPIFGVSFADTPTTRDFQTTLENIAELNGNYLFLTRYGRVFFHQFTTIRDTVADFLPFEYLINSNYTYSPEDVYKNIIVNYDYYRNDDDIEMQGVDQVITAGSLDFNFDVHPQYNGRPLIGDVVLDVGGFQPVGYTDTPAFGSASATFTEHNSNIYTYYTTEANNSTDLDYRLSLVSRDSGSVWYADQVDQQFIEDGTDPSSLLNITYANPLVTSPFMAETFAQLQAARRGNIRAWFDSATVSNRDDDTLDFLLTHTLGDVVYIQEQQTGNVPKHLCIIGERWSFNDGFFQMQYTLSPTGGTVGNVCAAEFDVDIDHETLTVTFTNESEANSEILATFWDFGDGNTSTDANPVHEYAENGTYEVCLTITTAYCTDTICHTVPVAVVDEWIHIFDFTASDGGFEAGGTSYVPGVGWQSVTNSSPQIVNLHRDFDSRTITFWSVTYLWNTTLSPRSVFRSQVTKTGGTSGTTVNTTTSTVSSNDNDIVVADTGAISEIADYININLSAISSTGTKTITVLAVEVHGEGIDPF